MNNVPQDHDLLASTLVGRSTIMAELRSLIRRVAPSRLPVLIGGPTGAGKELVAHSLHLASGRRGAYIAFNVCAVAETMFEDALFGHARGAFTGASSDSAGYLTEADKGTLFLDEISGLSLTSQAKLLRAIETQTFRSVGGKHDRRSDFRVVAASNENLLELCQQGRFRLDLYHRLAGISLRVPAISERTQDIPELVDVFLRAHTNDVQPTILPSAVLSLVRYSWSGNVRQLRHVVELSVTLSDGKVVKSENVDAALAMYMTQGSEERKRMHDTQRELLVALEEAGWSVPIAASRLGIHRATVYRRLARISNSSVAEYPQR